MNETIKALENTVENMKKYISIVVSKGDMPDEDYMSGYYAVKDRYLELCREKGD